MASCNELRSRLIEYNESPVHLTAESQDSQNFLFSQSVQPSQDEITCTTVGFGIARSLIDNVNIVVEQQIPEAGKVVAGSQSKHLDLLITVVPRN